MSWTHSTFLALDLKVMNQPQYGNSVRAAAHPPGGATCRQLVMRESLQGVFAFSEFAVNVEAQEVQHGLVAIALPLAVFALQYYLFGGQR